MPVTLPPPSDNNPLNNPENQKKSKKYLNNINIVHNINRDMVVNSTPGSAWFPEVQPMPSATWVSSASARYSCHASESLCSSLICSMA